MQERYSLAGPHHVKIRIMSYTFRASLLDKIPQPGHKKSSARPARSLPCPSRWGVRIALLWPAGASWRCPPAPAGRPFPGAAGGPLAPQPADLHRPPDRVTSQVSPDCSECRKKDVKYQSRDGLFSVFFQAPSRLHSSRYPTPRTVTRCPLKALGSSRSRRSAPCRCLPHQMRSPCVK